MAGSAPEPELEEIPDRFARIVTEEDAPAVGLGGVGSGRGGGGLMLDGLAEPEAAAEAPPAKLQAKKERALMIIKGGEVDKKPMDAAPGGGGGSETAVRQWFPEAFLWRPVVETNDDGIASLDVRVPDQLTTWRVLALAHDENGHQAGTTHTFDTTLPAYIDPVVPGWSYVGDEILMPVQVVNNQNQGNGAGLLVQASGALTGQLGAQISVGPYASTVESVPLVAVRAGQAEVLAELAGVDAVNRTWPVHPTGRPVTSQRGGVLTGSRAFSMRWPEGTDERTARLQVEIHPGPLAVLSTELERLGAGARGNGAYAYGLSGHLEALSAASGAELDEAVVRKLKIRAWQRLVRAARSPNAGQAADLLLGLQSGEGGPLVENLRTRLVRTVVDGQRGDGTWARQSRDTLQRVLVQTAVAMRALPESESGALIRAEGALERNLPNVDDPYTAAVLLATGRVANAELLETLVIEGLVEVDGEERKTVAVPSGVKSAWGSRPTKSEMLAWTALALADRQPDIAGDLVAELMTTYSSARGFGAFEADSLALEAVVKALPTVDAPVQITLRVNGTDIATGAVDPKQPGIPALLIAEHPGGDAAEIELVASPASAGLSFVATQRAWVPWGEDQGLDGIEVEVAQSPLRAGRQGSLDFTLAAPSGAAVTVVQGLPAGMSVDGDALKRNSAIRDVDVQQDRFSFTTKPFGAGEVLEVQAAVTPTYAGRMVSRPLEIQVGRREAMAAPHRWEVGR